MFQQRQTLYQQLEAARQSKIILYVTGDRTQLETPYTFKRALIESVAGGSHAFISEGTLLRQQIQIQPGIIQNAITDNRTFEGWRHFP
jgi:hypothetical protein